MQILLPSYYMDTALVAKKRRQTVVLQPNIGGASVIG